MHANKKNARDSAHKDTYLDALAALKKAGLKLTIARQRVLAYLTEAHGPFTVEEIHAGIRLKSCNLTTVYRILAHLEAAQLVRRTELGDRMARYEFQSSAHPHHHLICRSCHKVEVFEAGMESLKKIAQKIAQEKGFRNVNPWLELYGTCTNCS